MNGTGVAKDDKKAAQWYRKAADQGLAEAQLHLGFMSEQRPLRPRQRVPHEGTEG